MQKSLDQQVINLVEDAGDAGITLLDMCKKIDADIDDIINVGAQLITANKIYIGLRNNHTAVYFKREEDADEFVWTE